MVRSSRYFISGLMPVSHSLSSIVAITAFVGCEAVQLARFTVSELPAELGMALLSCTMDVDDGSALSL